MLCDAHVHTGWLDERYHAPRAVAAAMRRAGVGRWAYSASTAFAHPWKYARRDYELTFEAAPAAIPLLWVTPKMLSRDAALRVLDEFPAPFAFRGLKIHGHNGWDPDGRPLRRVWAIARERGLPILIHTGEDEREQPRRFAGLLRDFPEVRTIQAHMRPFAQAFANMREFPNAWGDTSFMPNAYLKTLAQAGPEVWRRVLFGSDYPATGFFYKTPFSTLLHRRASAVARHGQAFFEAVTEGNFGEVFGKGED
jgi:predicted TIM-barrel fold metal-dependent hydrolase